MAMPGEVGWIGKDCPDHAGVKLKPLIMRSGAGYFVATQCPQCRLEDPSPHSRESDYYESAEDVQDALDGGKVKWRDTAYRPGPMEVRTGQFE